LKDPQGTVEPVLVVHQRKPPAFLFDPLRGGQQGLKADAARRKEVADVEGQVAAAVRHDRLSHLREPFGGSLVQAAAEAKDD
jgi:hypothetical protein